MTLEALRYQDDKMGRLIGGGSAESFPERLQDAVEYLAVNPITLAPTDVPFSFSEQTPILEGPYKNAAVLAGLSRSDLMKWMEGRGWLSQI